MSRRRIEMFQYRNALAQMRHGASDREIARSHLLGRHKLAALRELATRQGWLDPETPLPEEAGIAACLDPRERLAVPSCLAPAPF